MKLHGMSHTHEYQAYADAKNRCNNPKHPGYANYGGRGIQFKFLSFMELFDEIGLRPNPTDWLDRIDNEHHYEKGNIRWASASVGIMNRRGFAQSGFRGVYQDIYWRSRGRTGTRKNPWVAQTFVDGQRKCLGTFKTAEAAAHAYDAEVLKNRGDIALLNFPLESSNA
jgi:hypothetical protein